ncbi:hypothetical protein NDU88_002393 [Pleurodeles waltl]|uniref:Uncharacterized protein n=1 Tax=Pleurodeles waltl TaxID=8319 RepID=A0AAV7UAN2_PLEWA|nr:hypothetical protein NDU88_002393 [Pleurodeles waltl]
MVGGGGGFVTNRLVPPAGSRRFDKSGPPQAGRLYGCVAVSATALCVLRARRDLKNGSGDGCGVRLVASGGSSGCPRPSLKAETGFLPAPSQEHERGAARTGAALWQRRALGKYLRPAELLRGGVSAGPAPRVNKAAGPVPHHEERLPGLLWRRSSESGAAFPAGHGGEWSAGQRHASTRQLARSRNTRKSCLLYYGAGLESGAAFPALVVVPALRPGPDFQ